MEHAALIDKTLRELLRVMGVAHSDVAQEEIAGQSVFSIRVDDGRELIGHNGDTVHALDHLVKKMLEKQLAKNALNAPQSGASGEHSAEQNVLAGEEPFHFLVDVNDYRSKHIRDLQAKALMMAERARSFQYDVELTPMSSYERLIVHTALHNSPNVKTESQGEGRNRRVVIRYQS